MKVLMAIAFLMLINEKAIAGISFEPYYSVRSTKTVTGNRAEGTETEKIKQREEKGLRAGIRLGSLFQFTFGVGQSFTETTTTENEIVDEFDEIDFSSDLDSSTEGKEKKVKEFDNRARISFSFDPSFSIFIFRLKAGVTAKQRIQELLIDDELQSRQEPDPTYNPHAGFGFGIRFNSQMFWMAEYSFDYYKFPELEPFERDLSVSFGFSI